MTFPAMLPLVVVSAICQSAAIGKPEPDLDGPLVDEAYLKGSNTAPLDRFGSSVAASGDTVVVGAPHETSGTPAQEHEGAVHIYVRHGSTWKLQADLGPSSAETGERFGTAVALSGDTLVVGAPGSVQSDNPGGTGFTGAGSAYVFIRQGNTWTLQTLLRGANTELGDEFGSSVALSGNTVVVGAPQEDGENGGVNPVPYDDWNFFDSGAAYVFALDGGKWNQQACLKNPKPEHGGRFGKSVAISGRTIVVGCPGEDTIAWRAYANSGATYVFTKDAGSGWNQQARLIPDEPVLDAIFGTAVAIHDDLMLVGAPGVVSRNGFGQYLGQAYVFRLHQKSWRQIAILEGDTSWEANRNDFGRSVAMDADRMIVGAAEDDSSTAENAGAAYVFNRPVRSGSPNEDIAIKASNVGRMDGFGGSVAISGDTVVVGSAGEDGSGRGVSPAVDEGATEAGAAYVSKMIAPKLVLLDPKEAPIEKSSMPLNFGRKLLHRESRLQKITIRNEGTANAYMRWERFDVLGSGDFTIHGLNKTKLAPGEKHSIEIRFKPKTGGMKETYLQQFYYGTTTFKLRGWGAISR